MRRPSYRCPSTSPARSASPRHGSSFGLVARSGPRRTALTLLEVVVSLAIFLFSIAALAHLISFATDQALDAKEKSQALLHGQRVLAEVASGALPLEAQAETEFEHDRNYFWSLECTESDVTGLWDVTVTVTRVRQNGTKIEAKLSQMILDPSLRGSSVPAAAAAAETTPASSSSSSSTTPTTPTTPSGGK